MEEKEIIKGKKCKTIIFIPIAFILSIIIAIFLSVERKGIFYPIRFDIPGIIVGEIIGFVALGIILHLIFSKVEFTVTDKRIYGTAILGRRVDLPLDSVSAIGTSWFKTIKVTTSSGKISFPLMKNLDELHSKISELLIERQKNIKEQTQLTQPISRLEMSNADELKKFKELLDDGVITQEEFDQKKKQLLGL